MANWMEWTFDKTVTSLMTFFGVNGIIIGLVVLAFFIKSWIDGFQLLASLGRTGHRVALRAGTAMVLLGPVRVAGALLVTVSALWAQVLTLGLCFIGGNYIGVAVDDERYRRNISVLGSGSPGEWLHFDRIRPILTLDRYSGGYVVLAGIIILISYFMRDGESSRFRLGAALAFPASFLLVFLIPLLIFFGLICAFIMLVSLVFSGTAGASDFWDQVSPHLTPMLTGAGVCALYFASCQGAIFLSFLTRESWSATRRRQPVAGTVEGLV